MKTVVALKDRFFDDEKHLTKGKKYKGYEGHTAVTEGEFYLHDDNDNGVWMTIGKDVEIINPWLNFVTWCLNISLLIGLLLLAHCATQIAIAVLDVENLAFTVSVWFYMQVVAGFLFAKLKID